MGLGLKSHVRCAASPSHQSGCRSRLQSGGWDYGTVERFMLTNAWLKSGQTLRHSVIVWFPRGFSDSFRPNWGWKPKVRHLHPQTCWISIPGGVHRGLLFGPLGSQRSSPCTVAHCLHIGSSASRFAPRSACTWEMAWNWRPSMELSNRYELVVCKVFWSGPAGIVPIYVARGEIPKIENLLKPSTIAKNQTKRWNYHEHP